MWIDLPNWQAQSSFVEPVAPVGDDPLAAPLVAVQFNASWLPYVIGSLMQLVQPAAWATSDPTVLAEALQDAQDLINLFGGAEAPTMLTFQFDSGCVLQYSLDGGATWTDVAGWPTYAPECYTGPEGPTGATGPAGGFTPGTPPAAPGQTTSEQACSIAGYIAQYVIQTALSSVVNGYNTGQTALEVATGILALIPGVDVVFAAITGAITLLYSAVTSGTISEFTAAESDPVLLADLTCAIYSATNGDGYVTEANFASVQANIAAISYTYPDVISAISDWLDAFGYGGLAAAQVPGAYTVVDCSSCPAWTWTFDFTVSDGGWEVVPASGGGSYASGQGWASSVIQTNGYTEIDVQLPSIGSTVHVLTIEVIAQFNTAANVNGANVTDDGPATVNVPFTPTAGAFDQVFTIDADMTALGVDTFNDPGALSYLQKVIVVGSGTPPAAGGGVIT
jgi:hypothetical protein